MRKRTILTGARWLLAAFVVVGLLAAAPAAAAHGRVAFTKISIDRCEDFFGTCEWKLTCSLAGGPPTDVVANQVGMVATDHELDQSYSVKQFPARLDCALFEDDGWFGEDWLKTGEVSLNLPGGGDYVLDLNGEEGAVLVEVAVDSLEIGAPLAAPPAPATPAKGSVAKAAAKTPAKPDAARQYVAVYSRDPDGHGVVIGLPWEEFQKRVDAFAAAGVKLISMRTWEEEGGERLWSGLFRTLKGKQEIVTGLEWDPFVARWNELSKQGMRLNDMEIVPQDKKFTFVGVYHEGVDDNPVWIGQSQKEFQSKWTGISGTGARLADLEVYKASGKWLYAGVFRGGSGSYGMWNGLTWEELQEKWVGASAGGSTISDLVTYKDGEKRLWDAVLRGGAGEIAPPRDATAFAKEWDERVGKGLRLVTLETYR